MGVNRPGAGHGSRPPVWRLAIGRGETTGTPAASGDNLGAPRRPGRHRNPRRRLIRAPPGKAERASMVEARWIPAVSCSPPQLGRPVRCESTIRAVIRRARSSRDAGVLQDLGERPIEVDLAAVGETEHEVGEYRLAERRRLEHGRGVCRRSRAVAPGAERSGPDHAAVSHHRHREAGHAAGPKEPGDFVGQGRRVRWSIGVGMGRPGPAAGSQGEEADQQDAGAHDAYSGWRTAIRVPDPRGTLKNDTRENRLRTAGRRPRRRAPRGSPRTTGPCPWAQRRPRPRPWTARRRTPRHRPGRSGG
jgi:hypothetical protein